MVKLSIANVSRVPPVVVAVSAATRSHTLLWLFSATPKADEVTLTVVAPKTPGSLKVAMVDHVVGLGPTADCNNHVVALACSERI